MPVAVEWHVRIGLRRAQTTIKVQVPMEERQGASKVDVQVQSCGDLIFGKCLSDVCAARRRLRGCHPFMVVLVSVGMV